MTFVQIFLIYLVTIPIFLVIDLVWLGFVAKNLYQTQLAHLLGPVNWHAAIMFYCIFVAGVVYFAVLPALEAESLKKAIIIGALFGFFTYATYDLTNLSTLKDWPLSLTFIDIVWGTFLASSVAALSYFVASKFIL